MAPHKRAQIRPRLRTAVPFCHHPSGRGRTHGYATEFRLPALRAQFSELGRHPCICLMQLAREWSSRRSHFRWRRRYRALGHLRKFWHTGNRRATVLRGFEQLHIAIWHDLWPCRNHHEANVWLFHAGGQVRFYHPSQISRDFYTGPFLST